jgi:hypothetical protein
MHDDLIERRLRTALSDEATGLPFTITSTELERRVALRGRSAGNRRLTLLLAAGVAVGAIGVAALAGALSNRTPAPTTPVVVVQPTVVPTSDTSPQATPVALLPSLDELIGPDDSDVLLAQAYGPADGNAPVIPLIEQEGHQLLVHLGEVSGDGEYHVSVVCSGGTLRVSIRAAGASGEIGGDAFQCQGELVEATITAPSEATVDLVYRHPTSWRVVIRSTHPALPLPTTNPILPVIPEGIQELARRDNNMIGTNGEPWAGGAMSIQEIGTMAGRRYWATRAWCEPGNTIGVVLADRIEGTITAGTETRLLCDGLVHELSFDLAQPNGSRIFVAAPPEARWSIVVESATPPVDYAQVDGWRLEGALGPELSFETHESAFTSGLEQGGRLMIVLDCVGPEQDVEVTVDVTVPLGDETGLEHFTARCTTEGQETGKEFVSTSGGFVASYTATAGTWSTLTILSPDPGATPN